MQIKKLLAPVIAPLAISAMFGLVACGDDSSSDNNAASAVIPDPTPTPTPTPTPDPTPTPTPDPTPTPTPGTWTPTVALASGANANYATVDYNLWKPSHFVTLEEESVYYSNIAEDFVDVFPVMFQPAGRVVWSAQSSGYYRDVCMNSKSAEPTMKFRGCTVSEGIGYGMLLTYFNEDNDAFVRLWNYSRAFRFYNETKLTPWITYNFHYKRVDLSSATDADLDIATALVLMYKKTGLDIYLQDALTIIAAIWDLEINKNSLLIYSGDMDVWNGGDGNEPIYNPSYFSPVALRLFAEVDPTHDWTGVLNAMYTYMAKIQDNGTGVFPDWSTEAGVAGVPNNGSADKTYWTFNKEAVRVPWRIAWDYYWYNEPRALAILQKLNAFIVAKSAGDPSSKALGNNYSCDPAKPDIELSGTAIVPSHWLAAWCATGLGTNPEWLNACTNLVNATQLTNSNTSYYTDILLSMYSALLNGKFVKP